MAFERDASSSNAQPNTQEGFGGGGVRRNSERRNVLGGHRRGRSLVQGIDGQVTVGEGIVGTRRRTGPLRSYSPNSLLELGTSPWPPAVILWCDNEATVQWFVIVTSIVVAS